MMHAEKISQNLKKQIKEKRKIYIKSKLKNQTYEKPFRQEPVVHTPAHKDYLPDITQAENESDYREEDEAPGGPEDYEEDYHENGMPDKKK